MTDWQRVEAIFGRALELEAAERVAYLDRVCADDPALRAEVESLLASDADASPTFLDQPLEAPDDLMETAIPEPLGAGETVGAYRLLERLGEGGMGTVYLARRADGAFEREVAVKVLRAGLRGEAARQRFDLERRILAGLDHPGIARLLDGGTTEGGAPFVVMERIDGQPIDRHCDHHNLSTEARIDLLIEVCDAVAAAHRSLVVHRDLKPSNVLVDVEGHAKLLDFGIAKILDPEQAEALGAMAGETTVGWQRVLTPNYASPEQLRGERITVATDVYLLGILLYKLLTGGLPHRLENRSLAQVEEIVTQQRPEPPSRRLRRTETDATGGDTTPSGVSRIDPDLDLVVLKALRRDPEERYSSVEALGADLRSWRQGLPIEARAGNRRYRLRKFVSRHRRALAVATAAVLLLALFAIDRALQVERREAALVRAEAALARSETLRGFVEGLFWEADPAVAKGQPLTVTQALDRGEAKLERSPNGSPSVRASMHALLGRIRYDLGEIDAAGRHLERALDLFATVAEPEPADRVATLRAQGFLGLARFRQLENTEVEDPDAVVEEALAEARRAYEASRYLAESDPELAFELSDPLAELYCWLGRYDEAAPLTAEALELIRRAGEPRTERVAVAFTRQALVLKNREGDLEGARALYQRALELFRELEGPTYPEVGNTLNQIALVAEDLGDFEGARESHREALEVRRRLYGDHHWEIGQSLQHLGSLALADGDVPAAIDHFEELVSLTTDLYGSTDSRTMWRSLLLCQALVAAGRFEEAEVLARVQLDEEHRKKRPEGSRLLVWAEGALGVALLAQGDESGRPLLDASLETLRANSRSYEGPLAWLEEQSESFL